MRTAGWRMAEWYYSASFWFGFGWDNWCFLSLLKMYVFCVTLYGTITYPTKRDMENHYLQKVFWEEICYLGGGNSNIFLFSPRSLGKWSKLTSIFQMDWFNHHLVMFASQEGYTKIDVNKHHLPETSTFQGEESELPTTNFNFAGIKIRWFPWNLISHRYGMYGIYLPTFG